MTELGDSKDLCSKATITVRLIRSFQHRNIKHIVLKDIDLTWTTSQFIDFVRNYICSLQSIPPPFRNFSYDTMKIQHKSHGAKTSDPAINTENDEKLMLKGDVPLMDSGVENETEISFFKRDDYLIYQANPHTEW